MRMLEAAKPVGEAWVGTRYLYSILIRLHPGSQVIRPNLIPYTHTSTHTSFRGVAYVRKRVQLHPKRKWFPMHWNLFLIRVRVDPDRRGPSLQHHFLHGFIRFQWVRHQLRRTQFKCTHCYNSEGRRSRERRGTTSTLRAAGNSGTPSPPLWHLLGRCGKETSFWSLEFTQKSSVTAESNIFMASLFLSSGLQFWTAN